MKKFSNLIKRWQFSTSDYWDNRYKQGGNSGEGSTGRLAEFKTDILCNIVEKYDISSIVDLGCGDGNQIEDCNVKQYTGLDISPTALKLCRIKYKDDERKRFLEYSQKNLENLKADLAISLDVIYHITGDREYYKYLTNLFRSTHNYVLIYSSDKTGLENLKTSVHVKLRYVIEDIRKLFPEFELIQKIENPYSVKNFGERLGSFSNFYLYTLKKSFKV